MTDIEKVKTNRVSNINYAQYLLTSLGPDLREAGYTATADDVEDAGSRLLQAAEDLYCLTLAD